jgi:hypothetical protein
MGIVAYCPNGHRIKVKDKLAGKRGLCPTCGAKFRIPKIAGGLLPPVFEEAVSAALPLARFVPIDPGVVASLPRALPYGTGRGGDEPVKAAGSSAARAAGAEQPWAPAITERADQSWCIALPGGTPSEPIDGRAMQEWLVAGRATGGELVWRADWPDWRPVRGVFPEFFPGS